MNAMKNEYVLSKHRFYELKHFCLQFPEWETLYSVTDGWAEEVGQDISDTTSRDGILKAELAHKMELVRNTANSFCGKYSEMVFNYAAYGTKPKLSFWQKDFWYYYRLFFWELSRQKE